MDLGYLAHPEGDKCYQVTEPHEGQTIFVWARFNAEARREGANSLDREWDEVECSRFKELDHFDGDLLTWRLDRGWSFSCSECEEPCYQENVFIVRGDVFCSRDHADKYHAHWDAVHALQKRFLAFAQQKWPAEEPSSAYVNTLGDGIIHTNCGSRLVALSELPPE